MQVQTTSQSANITVSKGVDYSLYAYVGNYQENDPTKGVVGYRGTRSAGASFSSDFYLIDTDEKATAAMTFSGLWPGYRVSYCLAVSNVSKNRLKMDLTRFTSEKASATNARLKRCIYGNTSTLIEIGWAINIYTDAAATSTNYVRHLNKKLISDGTTVLTDNFAYAAGTAIPVDQNQTYTTPDNSHTNLLTTATISNHAAYIFYTIEFSDETSTYFQECNSQGNAISLPASSGDRLYKSYATAGNAGDSSCYSDLAFSIQKLTVSEFDVQV